MSASEAGHLACSYLGTIEERARLHARPGLPADLAWVEWPRWDGGAIHALARRTRGRWRTTLLLADRGHGPEDVLRRLRAPACGPDLPTLVDGPDIERARIVLGALCGDLRGMLGLALGGSAIARDDRVLRDAEAWHAREIAPMVELLHGSEAVDAFGDCAAGRIHPDAVGPLTAPDATGEALRALRRSHPLVARLALSSTLAVRALCAGEDLHAALAVPCPGYTPAHLRRAAGATMGPIAAQVPEGQGQPPDDAETLAHARRTLRLAASLPPDWMPRDPQAWTALATVSAALSAGIVLGPGNLRHSKGDWVGLVARMTRAADIPAGAPRQVSARLAAAAAGLVEVQQSLLKQVMLPLVANAGHRTAYPGDGIEVDAAAEPAMRAVDALLWSDKDVGACLELARSWKGRRDAIDRTVADVESGGGLDLRWAPLGRARRHGAVEVRPIVDALALWEEGASTPDRDGHAGLSHCIYGRLRLFRAGHAHVLSLRRSADGARLSTAQVAVDGDAVSLVEHRGANNADPPAEAHEAVERFLAEVRSGLLGPLPERPAREQAPDGLWDLCGYDWRRTEAVDAALGAWAPLLPRWIRGLPAGPAFDALVARGLLDPVA